MLEHLPPELLAIILSYLQDHRDRYNFTTLNAHFYGTLRRSFYTNITLFGVKPKNHVALQFFMTIAQSPELADAVQELELQDWEMPPIETPPTGTPLTLGDSLKSLVEESGIIKLEDHGFQHLITWLAYGVG